MRAAAMQDTAQILRARGHAAPAAARREPAHAEALGLRATHTRCPAARLTARAATL